MFEDIEEIYSKRTTSDRKIKRIAIISMVATMILMIIVFIMKKTLLLYITTFAFIIILIALKCIIYLKEIKPSNFIDLLWIKEKYNRILYNNTKQLIKELLIQKNNNDINSINALINYYKDVKPVKKIDVIHITNYIFSFLAAFGVILTIKNIEILNTIYILICYLIFIVILFYGTSKILDKLFDGILDCQVNYKQIYIMLNEIYLEKLSNSNIKEKTTFMGVDSMQCKYIQKIPTAEEFNNLTEAVDWGRRELKIVEEALNNTLYSLCVYDEDKLIGYGRIIGDKTIFLYIHDIMVIPECQGKGIGKEIMKMLLKQIDEYKKVNPNIRTYLGASKGKKSFYEKFGFVVRPNEELGAGMILNCKPKEL